MRGLKSSYGTAASLFRDGFLARPNLRLHERPGQTLPRRRYRRRDVDNPPVNALSPAVGGHHRRDTRTRRGPRGEGDRTHRRGPHVHRARDIKEPVKLTSAAKPTPFTLDPMPAAPKIRPTGRVRATARRRRRPRNRDGLPPRVAVAGRKSASRSETRPDSGRGHAAAPRLAGVAKAAEMCAGGEPIVRADALASGIIDKIVEGDLLAGATAFAREV